MDDFNTWFIRISWTSKPSGEKLPSEIVMVGTMKVTQVSVASRQDHIRKQIKSLEGAHSENKFLAQAVFRALKERAHHLRRYLQEGSTNPEITSMVTSGVNLSNLQKTDGSSKRKMRNASICHGEQIDRITAQKPIKSCQIYGQ